MSEQFRMDSYLEIESSRERFPYLFIHSSLPLSIYLSISVFPSVSLTGVDFTNFDGGHCVEAWAMIRFLSIFVWKECQMWNEKDTDVSSDGKGVQLIFYNLKVKGWIVAMTLTIRLTLSFVKWDWLWHRQSPLPICLPRRVCCEGPGDDSIHDGLSPHYYYYYHL